MKPDMVCGTDPPAKKIDVSMTLTVYLAYLLPALAATAGVHKLAYTYEPKHRGVRT